MQTQFGRYAATSVLGSLDSPPRDNGTLMFRNPWEERAFSMAIALAKTGHFEWEDFRQALIAAIAEWEAEHARDDPSWDYYQRWLLALERLVVTAEVIDVTELEDRTAAFLEQLKSGQELTS